MAERHRPATFNYTKINLKARLKKCPRFSQPPSGPRAAPTPDEQTAPKLVRPLSCAAALQLKVLLVGVGEAIEAPRERGRQGGRVDEPRKSRLRLLLRQERYLLFRALFQHGGDELDAAPGGGTDESEEEAAGVRTASGKKKPSGIDWPGGLVGHTRPCTTSSVDHGVFAISSERSLKMHWPIRKLRAPCLLSL